MYICAWAYTHWRLGTAAASNPQKQKTDALNRLWMINGHGAYAREIIYAWCALHLRAWNYVVYVMMFAYSLRCIRSQTHNTILLGRIPCHMMRLPIYVMSGVPKWGRPHTICEVCDALFTCECSCVCLSCRVVRVCECNDCLHLRRRFVAAQTVYCWIILYGWKLESVTYHATRLAYAFVNFRDIGPDGWLSPMSNNFKVGLNRKGAAHFTTFKHKALDVSLESCVYCPIQHTKFTYKWMRAIWISQPSTFTQKTLSLSVSLSVHCHPIQCTHILNNMFPHSRICDMR